MLRQPSGLEHVFEQVAAQQRLWPKRAQPADIGSIGQIRPDIDARQFAHVDMEGLDTATAQWAKHLEVDPRLYRFTHHGRAAA